MKRLRRFSRFFRSPIGRVSALLSGLLSLMAAPLAYAVPTLGQIGTYQQQTAQGLSTGLYYFALFGGLLMVVVGIVMWGYAHKKHESPMVAIVIIIAGILLSSVIAVVETGSATVFSGSNQSQLNQLNIP